MISQILLSRINRETKTTNILKQIYTKNIVIIGELKSFHQHFEKGNIPKYEYIVQWKKNYLIELKSLIP